VFVLNIRHLYLRRLPLLFISAAALRIMVTLLLHLHTVFLLRIASSVIVLLVLFSLYVIIMCLQYMYIVVVVVVGSICIKKASLQLIHNWYKKIVLTASNVATTFQSGGGRREKYNK
jgi:hypothetical protein